MMRSAAKLFAASLVTLAIALPGCDRTEEVLDVETPSGEVEVERNIDTGEVEVDVDD